MKIRLLVVGKTQMPFVKQGEDEYLKRLKHYAPVVCDVIPDVKKPKNRTKEELKKLEGERILSAIEATDTLILLDENGKSYSSKKFSSFLQEKMLYGSKRLVFVIGGAYGFSSEVYNRAQGKISLSPMTFSHQMVRVIFLEQLYRAFTIIKGEPYHHE